MKYDKENKVSSKGIIETIERIFNEVLSKAQLKNLGLIGIVNSKAERLSITGIKNY